MKEKFIECVKIPEGVILQVKDYFIVGTGKAEENENSIQNNTIVPEWSSMFTDVFGDVSGTKISKHVLESFDSEIQERYNPTSEQLKWMEKCEKQLNEFKKDLDPQQVKKLNRLDDDLTYLETMEKEYYFAKGFLQGMLAMQSLSEVKEKVRTAATERTLVNL